MLVKSILDIRKDSNGKKVKLASINTRQYKWVVGVNLATSKKPPAEYKIHESFDEAYSEFMNA